MGQEPLVMDPIAAGAKLVRELDQFATIKVAFWLKRDEDDEPHLYIASDCFGWDDLPLAYGEAQRILREAPSLALDYSQVGLLSGDDRLAAAAETFRDDRLGTRVRSQMFAGQYIAEAYVYPSIMSPNFPRAK